MPSATKRSGGSFAESAHGRGGGVRAVSAGRVRIFEEDPELKATVSELPAATARATNELSVSSWRLNCGRWDPRENPPVEDWDCGYLVLDGLLFSRVEVGSRCSGELLGAGDVFRTDDPDTHEYATVASRRGFRVLAPARFVVLDGGLVARIDGLPGIASLLQRRLTQRARSLNVRLAIAQVPQLTARLRLLLWHLADRWGRICPEGALIPFPLSHEVLAACASAQRTSVLSAIHELEERGAVERTAEGHWLLHGEPPVDLT